MTPDLFADCPPFAPTRRDLLPGVVLLHGFALRGERALLSAIETVATHAPFRHMTTPGGWPMSVATTNCGELGWITDRRGYRYGTDDPEVALPWPTMPEIIGQTAESAAAVAGWSAFSPDACLINRYEPGARMSLHQDRNERDFLQPIVSISLGLPAIFLLGGEQRSHRPLRVPLAHGDVLVWGGPSRLRFHGVLPVKAGDHPLTGALRYNLTLRRAS